jgi:hypothetical protein
MDWIGKVERLNAFTDEETLRSYQADLLTKGRFDLADLGPPQACFVLNYLTILYVWTTPYPVALVAENMAAGFPISQVVTSDAVVKTHHLANARLGDLAQHLLAGPVHPVNPDLPVRALVGDRNFAHFMWNQFPALVLANQIGFANVTVETYFDPLDFLRRYLDRIGVLQTKANNVRQRSHWQDCLTVLPGARFCGALPKKLLLDDILVPRGPNAKVGRQVYFSIRDQKRTILNQEEFLVEVAERICERLPDVSFLLDGYSVPEDQGDPIYEDQPMEITAKVAAVKEITGRIATQISERTQAHVEDMTGVGLREAINLLRDVSFGVTHAGTSQHKLGWFFDHPGVIHGNKDSLTPHAVRWHARMVAGAQLPIGLPEDLVEDVPLPEGSLLQSRDRDYVISDVAAAAAFIVDAADKALRSVPG